MNKSRIVPFLLAAALALLPSVPEAALSEVSSRVTYSTATPVGRITTMTMRCDNSAAIAGVGPAGGETCVSGSWWPSVDAKGAKLVGFYAFKTGASGSGKWSLYNCLVPAGAVGPGAIAGIDIPGVEDPAGTPSAADPDPLCEKMNTDANGTEIQMTGVSPVALQFADRTYGSLIVRTDSCTDCNATLELQVIW